MNVYQETNVALSGVAQCARRRLLILLVALAMVTSVGTPAWSAGVSDIIYLESNSTAGNSILTFQNNGSGTPTFLGSTPAGGIGVFDGTFALGPFDSDQNLVVNPEGTLLFAVNSGSNSIAVFRITAGGGLETVAGSPFPSGGSDPASVGLVGDTLVVVNKAQDPAQSKNAAQPLPNYTTFEVWPNGSLTPVENSTVSVAYGTSPSQALIAARGPFVFGADFLGGLLQSFQVVGDGQLKQNLPQGLPNSIFTDEAGPHLPLGLRTHPDLPILYVDIVPTNQVAVYSYDEKGNLSFVRAVKEQLGGAGPCWAVVNHAGTRLYVTNTGDASIEVYDLADPLNPAEIQHFVMDSTSGGAAYSTVIDSSGQWLYVSSEQGSSTATTNSNAFHSLKVMTDGTLTEPFAPAILPIGGTVPVRAQGITVVGAN